MHVEPEESAIVFLIIVFGFCIGAACNILYSVPLAMFLTHYSSSLLPSIYIAVGMVMLGGGFALGYLEKKVSVFYTMAIPMAIFSGLLLFLFLSLFLIKASWIFFVGEILSLGIAYFLSSFLSLMFNQLFTLQQSKRLFGLVITGSALGGILMGFGSDFVVSRIGSNNMILLGSALLLCSFVSQLLIKKQPGNRFAQAEESSSASEPRLSFKEFKYKSYLLYIFAFYFIVCLLYYYLDFLFSTEVQKHFSNEAKIASFFAIVYATCDIGGIFAGFVLSPWVLSRFGLLASLVVLPIGLVVIFSGVFLTNAVIPHSNVIFNLLFLSIVFESLIRDFITEESMLMLFQPLKSAQRAWAQLKIAVIISPLSIAIVGALLLLVTFYFPLNVSMASLNIITLSLITIAIVFFLLKNHYIQLLIESLSKRSIVNPQFIKLDKDSLSILSARLSSPYPEEVIYVLQTIEGIDQAAFEKALQKTIESSLEEVRLFSLRSIEQHQIRSMEPQVKQICVKEKNPTILQAAIPALGAIADLQRFAWFQEYLHGTNSSIAAKSIAALLKYGTETSKKEAITLLTEKVRSMKEEDRLIAADVLKNIDLPFQSDLLLPLLKDTNADIRRLASEAVKPIQDEAVYHALVENLTLPHVREAAFNGLRALGEFFFESMKKDFPDKPLMIQIAFVQLFGWMQSPQSLDFLLEILPTAPRKLLPSSLSAIKMRSYKACSQEKLIALRSLLTSEIANISFLKSLVQHCHTEKTQLLHGLFLREMEISRECCFSLLTFIYPKEPILQVQQSLFLDDDEIKSNAIELFLQTLDKADQHLLLDPLCFLPQEIEPALSSPPTEEFFVKTFDYVPHCFISEITAAVIYTIGALQLNSLQGWVRKQEAKGDRLMVEILAWTLHQFEQKA